MKICILTLGCKVNKYESDALMNNLLEKGYEVSEELERADIYVINTCAVTAEAEKKSRQMIAKCRKLNNFSKIFICGCASEHNSKQFIEKDVTYVSGVAGKLKITEFIDNLSTETKNLENILPLPKQYEDNLFAKQSRARAYIKIQDGCDNFCSYCIIPYLRGRSRSRELSSILEEAQKLDDNIKEIVLTGINVTDYKINGEKGLLKLLQELDKLDKRLRLSSMEESLMTEEFVQGISKLKNFCPHFHLSLQSGCDETLKRMNRHYTTKQFKESVDLIRKFFSLPGITTDVIVGFPNETEEEFNKTYEFIKAVNFSQLHIFPYSQRQGTAASKLYKDLPHYIKQERFNRLNELNNLLKKQFIEENKNVEVLVEEKIGDYYVGYSKNYIRCYISSNQDIVNQVVKAVIEKTYQDGVICQKYE